MIEIESESTLSNLSEMREFEAIPSINVRLIAHFLLVLLHEHDPKIDLVLAIVVDTLKVLTNFKGFVINDVAELIFSVFHTWIVRVSIVLWSKAIMVFACENSFWSGFSILQYK